MKQIAILIGISLLLCVACKNKQNTQKKPEATSQSASKSSIEFNADSAFQHVVRQCDFGPRVPGSQAHANCGDYIVSVFESYGLEVKQQRAQQTMWDGKVFECRNIIASHLPQAAHRILLCAHWDSRPWCDADADASKHRQPVMAANDGASGVAVMLELARQIQQTAPKVGIDFICFDLEDYGVPYWDEQKAPYDGSDWCVGSRYWAQTAIEAGYAAQFGILLDMVGGENAQFRHEGYSLRYAKNIVKRIWKTAATLGYGNYFLDEDGGWATDDHVPVNEIAGIPTVDIIPCHFDSENSFGPTWHTCNDTPEHISKHTLKAVGQTLVQLLSEEQK